MNTKLKKPATQATENRKKNVTALTRSELVLFRKFQVEQKRQDSISELDDLAYHVTTERDYLITLSKKYDKKCLDELLTFKANKRDLYRLKYIKSRLFKLGVCLNGKKNLANGTSPLNDFFRNKIG